MKFYFSARSCCPSGNNNTFVSSIYSRLLWTTYRKVTRELWKHNWVCSVIIQAGSSFTLPALSSTHFSLGSAGPCYYVQGKDNAVSSLYILWITAIRSIWIRVLCKFCTITYRRRENLSSLIISLERAGFTEHIYWLNLCFHLSWSTKVFCFRLGPLLYHFPVTSVFPDTPGASPVVLKFIKTEIHFVINWGYMAWPGTNLMFLFMAINVNIY